VCPQRTAPVVQGLCSTTFSVAAQSPGPAHRRPGRAGNRVAPPARRASNKAQVPGSCGYRLRSSSRPGSLTEPAAQRPRAGIPPVAAHPERTAGAAMPGLPRCDWGQTVAGWTSSLARAVRVNLCCGQLRMPEPRGCTSVNGQRRVLSHPVGRRYGAMACLASRGGPAARPIKPPARTSEWRSVDKSTARTGVPQTVHHNGPGDDPSESTPSISTLIKSQPHEPASRRRRQTPVAREFPFSHQP